MDGNTAYHMQMIQACKDNEILCGQNLEASTTQLLLDYIRKAKIVQEQSDESSLESMTIGQRTLLAKQYLDEYQGGNLSNSELAAKVNLPKHQLETEFKKEISDITAQISDTTKGCHRKKCAGRIK